MKKPPNILIVMTDHQRADTVLPRHPCHTPNVQRLIDEGVTFTRTYCPTPHCCPARASFFSGLYPSRHGVWNNISNAQRLSAGIHPDVQLWSKDLRAANYQLHFTGKWHVDTRTSPADHGFIEHTVSAKGDVRLGHTWDDYQRNAGTPHATTRGWGQMYRPGYATPMLDGFRVLTDPSRHQDHRTTTEALAALDQLTNQADPWALYVGFIGPHDPYVAPQEFLDLYDVDKIPLPASYHDAMRDKPNLYRRMREQIFDQRTEAETRDAIRHYWAYCSWLDSLFGQILDRLEASGQAENTLVLYCADHGDYCGDHGLFSKGIPCFDGAYHVPTVIRWPAGVAAPGRRVDELVSLCDFAPTFIEAAGLTVNRSLSGRSLVPFLAGQKPPQWRDGLLTQCNGVENYVTQRSILTKDWHYTYNAFDFDELYDLNADPHEMTNLAADPAYGSRVRELCARMWALARAEDDAPGNSYVTVALAPVGPGAAITGIE
jgi:arylsulfatase A-like enzyme